MSKIEDKGSMEPRYRDKIDNNLVDKVCWLIVTNPLILMIISTKVSVAILKDFVLKDLIPYHNSNKEAMVIAMAIGNSRDKEMCMMVDKAVNNINTLSGSRGNMLNHHHMPQGMGSYV